MRAFLSAANRPGIEKIEEKIHDAFISGTGDPSEVQRQLRRWVETRPDGKYASAIPAARALYDFLFAGSRIPAAQAPQPSALRSGSAIEPTLSLTLVHRMATAPLLRLADSEKPKFRVHAGRVLLDPSVEIVQPGAIPVFVSYRDRMIVLEGDSLLATLERKADGDRFDVKYARASRMGSANSEDAVTWSVLRTMELRGPAGWFRQVLAKGLERAGNQGSVAALPARELHFDYWVKVAPPAGLATREGETEFDALIRLGSDTLVSVEAKVGSPFSPRTRYGESRNQFIRNVDVAAEHAARIGRVCWLTVLVSRHDEENIAFVRSYVDDPGRLATALPHRAAEEASALARRVAILAWEDILESAGAPAEAAEAVEVPHRMSPDCPSPDSSGQG
jgi:hypothetical protein